MKSRRMLGISVFILSLFILVGCSFGSEEKKPTQIEKEPTIVEIQNEISETYKKISSGCVGIYANTTSSSGSVGSGVVYKEKNGLFYVVTNNHVIEGMKNVRIFRGGTKYYKANVVGTDKKNDLAVLTFSLDLFGGDPVYVHDIFSYDDEIVSPGQTVMAIGCPLGLENFNTLTTGVVSRVTKTQIQTNTEINPGNSGGGLFNASGRLIGINTEKEVYTQSVENGVTIDIPVEGIGFAISLNVVKKCITDIESKQGRVDRPLLGITVIAVNAYITTEASAPYVSFLPDALDQALVITEIEAKGVGKEAGLKVNDVILKINSEEITSLVDISAILSLSLFGDTITMEVYRPSQYKTMTFNITLS